MGRIDERFKYAVSPRANDAAVVCGDKYRFTVLTNKLIRIEYNDDGVFEDRATQVVVNRMFDKPEFVVEENEERLRIITDTFVLIYYKGREFTASSLSMKFRGEFASPWTEWHYGQPKPNFKGTIRTLDSISGEVPLGEGLMARGGFTQIDDSKSLIIAEDGWIERHTQNSVDLYVFSCTNDYLGTLKDYYHLTGRTPLLPRYALGNMWSRYYKYSQQEYLDLMDRFEKENCPFSVAVLDMDWHIVDGGKKYGTGWTGYTWNEELFPDYKDFLKKLHEKNLEVTLNLHPGDGVAPYEDAYEEMAEAMEVDKSLDLPVEFESTDPRFLENYFKILHHPYEKDGVTFWWMDWQQGGISKEEGMDPLWMLNHFHSVDMQSRGKRPLMLSRFSGFGSHRYPIGFSGDAVMKWESLDFQPYFTVNASNVGYTWWSHDIGGHWRGYKDDEMYVRWIQFGVFSPINRIHSTANPVIRKEPWFYNKIAEDTIKEFLRLRHKLIPYLYTMNYRTSFMCEPLMQPIYYKNDVDKAYEKKYRNEYYFGTEMLVMPITSKHDNSTDMGHIEAYIPEGIWFDFFNGRQYKGDKVLKLYREVNQYPVFVKAGGIIPMAEPKYWNDISNPENLTIEIYPGANNEFDLYEDDGFTSEYKQGAYSITKMYWEWDKKQFIVNKPEGDEKIGIDQRNIKLSFNNITGVDKITVTQDGREMEYFSEYVGGKLIISIDNVSGQLVVKLDGDICITDNNYKDEAVEMLLRIPYDNNKKNDLYDLIMLNDSKLDILSGIDDITDDKDVYGAVKELIIADL